MFRVPVTKDGDGIEHYSHGLDPSKLTNITRAVCDGKYWHVYEHGDEIPEAHAEQSAAAEVKPAPDAPAAGQNIKL